MAQKGQPGAGNFEFELIGDPASKSAWIGYDSTLEPTAKAPNLLDRGSQNIYKTPSGRIANRQGRLQYDAVDTTIAKVNAAYIWNTSKGFTYPVRISNSKYQFLSNISGAYVWYDLLTSMTKTRGVWDTYWDTTDLKDKLLMVIGDNNIYNWAGGVALFVSAVANTSITLDRDATSNGFASSGTVTINGTTYTYTGISGSSLTGVTGDASAQAANSVVFSTLITTSNKPVSSGFTNDFIKTINNQLYVGSYNSQTIYISKNNDYTDHSQSATRVPGEGATVTLDFAARGIAVRQGQAYVSAGTASWYIISFSQITVGATLTEQVNVAPQESAVGAAAYSHEMIDTINDVIVYLSVDQQLREFGTFRNLNQPAYPVISQQVSTELKGVDFTLGQLMAVADSDKGITTYIIAPNSGVVYMHQTILALDSVGNVIAERFWQPPFVWGISRIGVMGKIVYGFSNSNPQMYQLWDTGQWHDDSPSGQTAYTSILVTPYRSYGRRQGKFFFDKVYWEGYMTTGTSLYGAVYFDYQGATAVVSPIIHSIADNSAANTQSFFSGIVPPSLGGASLGDNPLGDITTIVGLGNTALTDHDLLSKFRIITPVNQNDCFEYALTCYSYKADDRWEIVALGVNAGESTNSAIEIIKRT